MRNKRKRKTEKRPDTVVKDFVRDKEHSDLITLFRWTINIFKPHKSSFWIPH